MSGPESDGAIDLADDEARLAAIADELADALGRAIPGWIEREVSLRATAAGLDPAEEDRAERVRAAGAATLALVSGDLRRVITADVDSGAGNPLAVLRAGVGPATELLSSLGVPPADRDEFARRAFPDDVYGLGPASFADVDESLHEPGLVWGAARAHVHLRRRAESGDPLADEGDEGPPVGCAAVTAPDFATILDRVADVEGWMTEGQARLLHDRARALDPDATLVEIGSFRGRSMIVLASSAPEGVELVAIDPHGGGDRGPQEIAPDQARGDDDNTAFEANLTRAGVRDRVRHVRKMSDAAHDDVDRPIDLLYIDGAHRFGPARADIVGWGERVTPGGTMLVHDSFSSIGVTLALLTTTFAGGGWRYVGRSRSMAEYRREDLGASARAGNLGRQVLQLPWFVRNVAVKVLLTLRLYPLTRLFGHTTRDWPY